MLETELEGTTVVVDVGGGEAAQDVGSSGLVESLDLAVALGIARGAEDDADVELDRDLGRVVGDEAGAAVEVERAHDAVAADDAVEPAQERLGGLRGADYDSEAVAARVVEKEQGDATGPLGTGAEVLAIGEDHHHPVRVGEAAHVGLVFAGQAAQGDRQTLAGAPDGGAVDLLVRPQDPAVASATQKLGDRRVAVERLLGAHELEERLG
jgi:hypothetical protein